MTDWLDDLLDRHPGERVPEGFLGRLRARIQAEGAGEGRPGRVLRPAWRWLPVAAAASVFLLLGYWLGRGRPAISDLVQDVRPGQVAEADLEEIFRNRDVLEAFDFVAAAELELAFRDAAVRDAAEAPAVLEEEGK